MTCGQHPSPPWQPQPLQLITKHLRVLVRFGNRSHLRLGVLVNEVGAVDVDSQLVNAKQVCPRALVQTWHAATLPACQHTRSGLKPLEQLTASVIAVCCRAMLLWA